MHLTDRFRDLPRDQPILTLVVAVLVVELVGASGSLFTVQGLGSWYETLARPALAPPNWVFGPVWTTLFALMGVAAWLVWRRANRQPEAARVAGIAFVAQFVLNLTWSAVFFGMQRIGAALAVIVGLWLLIVVTIWAFARVDRRAGALLVPYLLWVSFAGYLNYGFWTLN